MREFDTRNPENLRLIKAQLPQRLMRLCRRGERLGAQAWDVNTLALLERDADFLHACCRDLDAGALVDLLEQLRGASHTLLEQAQVPDAEQAAHVARLIAEIATARQPRAVALAQTASSRFVAGPTHQAGFPLLVAPPPDYWKRFGPTSAAATMQSEGTPAAFVAETASAASATPSAAEPIEPPAAEPVAREPAAATPPTAAFHLAAGDELASAIDARLAARGYAVARFADADSLLAALDAAAPAVIVVDAAFESALDAIGARVKHARKELDRRLVLIALGPAGDVDRRLHAIRIGCDALIEAPADADEIDRRIGELVEAASGDPYRIMIIEDDVTQTVFAESILRKAGMQTLAVADALDALDELERFNPDLILMDLYMPGCDGIDLTALIRQREAFVATPIVFLSGEHNADKHFEALDAGGDDFLSKPIRPKHLISAVTNRVSRARRLRRRDGAAAPTAASALSLPTLLQRAAAHLAIVDARVRNGGLLAFAIADFADVRARIGDAACGDLMAAVESVLAAHAGPRTLVARSGDGRFLMFEPDCDASLLEAYALKVRERVANEPFAALAPGGRIDVDVGVCAFIAGAERVEDMRDAAFEAIDGARTSGRSGVFLVRSVHSVPAAHVDSGEEDLADRIRFALDGIGFQLVFQPMVSLRGDEGEQFQALLRLQGDDQRVHTAAEVIPAAERAGLAGAVDRWVLENAVALSAARLRSGKAPPRLFVSLSLESVRAAESSPLKALLDAARLPPGALVLELRAAQIATAFDAFAAWAAATNELGVGIAVSGFEADALGERVLAMREVDYVKVAPRYLRLDEAVTRGELAALIEQAQAAGKRVVVPRVEDARAAAALWSTGADYIQGNFVQQAGQDFAFDFHGASI